MPLQETATYQVNVTFTTDQGELPADGDVEQLILDQMSGELDESTSLACVGVTFIANLTTAYNDEET